MLPTGIICLWYGSIVSIPTGWILCDGTNGTPDLRDKFIVGAGNAYAPHANGGASVHTHFFTSDGHSHTLPAGYPVGAGDFFAAQTNISIDSGNTDTANHLPPYKALCYIMKT